MKRPASVALLLVLATLLAACGQPPVLEGNLTGQVLRGNRSGLAGATVTAIAASDAAAASASLRAQSVDATSTDENGWFDLTLPAGRYTVLVTGGGLGAMRTVDVGDDRVELNLTATALGHVRGTATKDDGGDDEGILIRAKGTNVTARTNAGGEYVLTGLPAGEHTLVAEADGYASSDAVVTVDAGATVDAPALALASTLSAPSIESVPSLVFWNEEDVYLGGEPVSITITGSGFGDSMGVSRLTYFGMPIADRVVTEWTDTRITVSARHPFELFGSIVPYYGFLRVAADEPAADAEPRFEVRTLGGVATSEPARLVIADLYVNHVSTPTESADVGLEVYDLFDMPVDDLALTLETNLGTLEATEAVTDAHGWFETTLTTADSRLPHTVSVVHEGEVVAYDTTMCCYAYARTIALPDEAPILEIEIDAFDYAPVPDASFEIRLVENVYTPFAPPLTVDLGTYVTDESGVLRPDVSGLLPGHDYYVLVLQDGRIVGDADFDWGGESVD